MIYNGNVICVGNRIDFALYPSHPIVNQIFAQGTQFKGYRTPCYEKGGKLYFSVTITKDTRLKTRNPHSIEFDIVPDTLKHTLRLRALTIY